MAHDEDELNGEPGMPTDDSPSEPFVRALLPAPGGQDDGAEDAWSATPGERTWRQELPRWLASLDSGRTRREYEKAVGYFFEAPGVPQELGALTFDLLLAYRGSLALRADRQAQRTHRATMPSPGLAQLPPNDARDMLEGSAYAWEPEDGDPRAARGAELTSPLAPATVNVRLTALRQFLTHCSLWERVPQLPPERMRAALRRLKVERRRPYQVLEEREWAEFLRAAAGMQEARDASFVVDGDAGTGGAVPMAEAAEVKAGVSRASSTGPWGTPRATRARTQAPGAPDLGSREVERGAPASVSETPSSAFSATGRPASRRSRAGLTGRHTAQRDHALLSLALASGLRSIELCSLDVENVTREWHEGRAEWWLVLRDAQTKGQRGGRALPLAEPLAHTLLEYIDSTGRSWEHAGDRATPLFLSLNASRARTPQADDAAELRARRLAPEHVRRIVDRVETQWLAEQSISGDGQRADEASVRAISPHALRHSTAIALLEGNQQAGRPPASVEHVRGWLGHFDIRTTQGYLAHLDARRHRRPFALTPEPGAAPAASAGAADDVDSEHGG